MGEGDGRKADLKLVLVGGSGVGKTAIVTRLINNTFNTKNEVTLGASFFIKEWRGLLVAVWDTAGSEKFAPLTGFYLRRCDAALVVYDVADAESFVRAQDYWQKLEEESPNCTVGLLCNKMDLIEECDTIDKCQAGRDYARDKGVTFFEVSAKTGRNVEESFDSLCSRIFPDRPKDSTDPMPKRNTSRHSGLMVGNPEEEDDSKKASKCCE